MLHDELELKDDVNGPVDVRASAGSAQFARSDAAPALSEWQLRLLVRAGQTLGSSLDFHETLQGAASLMIPDMADWCAMDLLDADGRGVELVAVAHADPEKVAWARLLREKYPVDLDDPQGVGGVIRSGESLLLPVVPGELLRNAARDQAHLEAIEQVGFRSVLIAPLRARDTTIGALTLVWSHSERQYGEVDVEFAEEFARRAALAVDNARLFRWSRELNATLGQRVAERTAQVRSLASEMTLAESRERSRIARLLHDDLQQQIHVMQFQLSELGELARAGQLEDFEQVHEEMFQALKDASSTTRTLTGELSPVVLHNEDFCTAVRWLAERFADQYDLGVCVDGPAELRFTSHGVRDLVFSLVRECLFNVVKHSGVDRAWVELRETDAWVQVEIRDEGVGFDPETIRERVDGATGLGLRSAAQRLQLFGGELTVDSRVGRPGARVMISVPAGEVSNAEGATL